MFKGREKNDESILNSDTGKLSDSALSLTLVCFFIILKEKNLTSYVISFLNVTATKMYIFKKLWICYMMFARNKWGKSFIDIISAVNLFHTFVRLG